MNHALVSLACHAYVVAALVYLVYLVRQLDALATAGRVLVGTGLGLHGVALFGLFGAQGGRPVGLAQGFSTFAFLLLAIFLVVDVRYRRPVIGAFITPLAVAVKPTPAASSIARENVFHPVEAAHAGSA